MTTSDASVDKTDYVDKATLGGAIFIPEQYAEILKLLSKDIVQSSNIDHVVNIEGIHLSPSRTLKPHWIIDSGLNDHMVGEHLVWNHPDSVTTSIVGLVKLPNGHTTKASKLRYVRLTNTLTFHNALHYPVFDSNLPSVTKFSKDHNCFLTFYPHFF